ncbi:hypothetical protein GCM10022198_17740 [Klugiella xanthotipulae]|uniref:Uncharacterized protein n=1 Tax=Klugiella xanthotipulae TaxID=244735 RepID=A0A543HXJ1_9MICO|nr:hypothetical protein [Klugiella xanthotipulae]TQM63057.1 hypothetical protein FB466_1306 [Klugiella xanthotipulae]
MFDRNSKAFPWMIVSIIALVAIVIAVFVVVIVNGARSDEPEAVETTSVLTSAPVATSTPPAVEEETPVNSDVPEVEVGPTKSLAVSQWGVTFDYSTKLGAPAYSIEGDTVLVDTALVQTLPESCAAARVGWGFSRTTAADATHVNQVGEYYYGIAMPTSGCSEDSALFDELHGLYAALAASVH